MNRAPFLGHLCAHIGWTGPGEPPEDGEMHEMTLSSRHRMLNSSPGGPTAEHATSRSRRLPTILTFTREWQEAFKPPRPGTEPRTLAWKAAVLTTTLSGLNPLNPRDASKHNCVYMKNDLISYTQGFQNDNFHGTVLIITLHFFHLSYAASHLHPSQLENCDSNSRLCKFRLESRTYLPV